MYCESCGSLIKPKASFCVNCGKQVVGKNIPIQDKGTIASNSPQTREKTEKQILLGQARRVAGVEMLKGLGWMMGGALITGISYSLVSESGGTYLVTYGLIIYGIYAFFRALVYFLFPKLLLNKIK